MVHYWHGPLSEHARQNMKIVHKKLYQTPKPRQDIVIVINNQKVEVSEDFFDNYYVVNDVYASNRKYECIISKKVYQRRLYTGPPPAQKGQNEKLTIFRRPKDPAETGVQETQETQQTPINEDEMFPTADDIL